MKLKGKLTEHGARLLWKNFLPTIEKFGKTCQLLLGPDEIHIVQTSLNTDGVLVTARFAVETLFDRDTYRCQSKHYNLIAFQAEVGLLLRVLRGAAVTHLDSVDVKLTLRQVAGPTGESQSKPFLSFTATGASTTLVQDVPISKPYTPSEVASLLAAKDDGAFCPAYVDLSPVLGAAQALAERLKAVDDSALLALGRGGDAHLLVQTTAVSLGAQLRGLPVYPQNAFQASETDRSKPVSDQLQEALDAGQLAAVHIQLKQLSRVLSATALTEPAQVLCGIAEGGGHVHIMYVFRDPQREDVYDENTSLTFKLPVQED